MPLRDHTRSPVNDHHAWDEVHGQWPGEIVRQLFELLPDGYQASPKIHLGSQIEVDVGTYDRNWGGVNASFDDATGVVAIMTAAEPTLTFEADLSEQDQNEVLIRDRGRRLVAAIEIISPSNKANPHSRDLFIGKIITLLQEDVSVTVVDLVSTSRVNFYKEVLNKLDRADPQLAPIAPHMYAVTLRGRKRFRKLALLDAWFYPLTVGQALPTVPLWLSEELRVELPLEPGYEETCRLLRIA